MKKEDYIKKLEKLLDYHQSQTKDLGIAISVLKKIDDINTENIELVQSNSQNELPLIEQYNNKWTYMDKTLFAFKKGNRFLLTDNIVDIILEFDQSLSNEKVKKIVSVALNKLKVSGKIKGYKPIKMKGFYWGLSEWFIGDIPKDTYRHKVQERIEMI